MFQKTEMCALTQNAPLQMIGTGTFCVIFGKKGFVNKHLTAFSRLFD